MAQISAKTHTLRAEMSVFYFLCPFCVYLCNKVYNNVLEVLLILCDIFVAGCTIHYS